MAEYHRGLSSCALSDVEVGFDWKLDDVLGVFTNRSETVNGKPSYSHRSWSTLRPLENRWGELILYWSEGCFGRDGVVLWPTWVIGFSKHVAKGTAVVTCTDHGDENVLLPDLTYYDGLWSKRSFWAVDPWQCRHDPTYRGRSTWAQVVLRSYPVPPPAPSDLALYEMVRSLPSADSRATSFVLLRSDTRRLFPTSCRKAGRRRGSRLGRPRTPLAQPRRITDTASLAMFSRSIECVACQRSGPRAGWSRKHGEAKLLQCAE